MNGPIRLLIVDDSRIICHAIEQYLQGFDVEVVGYAMDGRQALEMFAAQRPDVVTLDITMPKMDGLTVLEEMRKRDSLVRILVVTALSDEETAQRARALGAHGFLNKPFTSEKLQQAFRNTLNSNHGESPANE